MDKLQLLQSLKQKNFPEEVIEAFSEVKREDFISEDLTEKAYDDTPLPIGQGQTISQPHTIAIMLSELNIKKGQKVLEIGSGSGYALSLLSELVGKGSSSKRSRTEGKVFGIEIIPELVKMSKKNLRNYKNVKVFNQSGSDGFPEKAPFDRILISAAIHEIPEKLMAQLKVGGVLVAPKGSRFEQQIITIKRISETEFMIKKLPGFFIFVPFVE